MSSKTFDTGPLAAAALVLLTALSFACLPLLASGHYTERQLAALATRIGKTFWVVAIDGRTPAFSSGSDARAGSFRPPANEAFEITGLVGQKAKNPYYKVKFASGQEAYLKVDTLLEELNASIVTVDPLADEKKAAEQEDLEEKKRLEWIQAQPWSQAVKSAAAKRQAVSGMTSAEVRKVLGPPSQTARIKSPHKLNEERWVYRDGAVLVFQNGLLNRVETKKNNDAQKKTP